jgi:hypothetical protein
VTRKALSLQEKSSGGKHVKKEKKLTNIGIEDALHFVIGFCDFRCLGVHGTEWSRTSSLAVHFRFKSSLSPCISRVSR